MVKELKFVSHSMCGCGSLRTIRLWNSAQTMQHGFQSTAQGQPLWSVDFPDTKPVACWDFIY